MRGQWNLVAIRTALETAGEIFLEGGQLLKWREGPNGAENTDHRLDRDPESMPSFEQRVADAHLAGQTATIRWL